MARLVTDETYYPGKVVLEFAPLNFDDTHDPEDFAPGEMGPGTTETWFDSPADAEAFLNTAKTEGYDNAYTALCKERGCFA
jgi:hypothetical protein